MPVHNAKFVMHVMIVQSSIGLFVNLGDDAGAGQAFNVAARIVACGCKKSKTKIEKRIKIKCERSVEAQKKTHNDRTAVSQHTHTHTPCVCVLNQITQVIVGHGKYANIYG